MARTILYRRVSTDEQALGLAAQLDQLEGAAALRGWEGAEVVTDEGVSGGVPVDKRRNLGPVLATFGVDDRLVVAKLDRLSRSMLDFAALLQRAERDGWTLVVLDLGIDTTTPQGKLVGHMVVALGQWEREIIGLRIKEGLAKSPKRKGRPPGQAGTKTTGLYEITPELRDTVTTLRPGRSPNEIAHRLNAQGHSSPRGKDWHRTSVRRLLARLDAEAA